MSAKCDTCSNSAWPSNCCGWPKGVSGLPAVSEAQRVIELERQVRHRGIEAVVVVGIDEPPVQHDEGLLTGAGDPVQAAVETEVLGYVVVLDEVAPGQRG